MQGIYKTNSYMASYTYLHSCVAMYIIYYKIAAYVAICKLISLSLIVSQFEPMVLLLDKIYST